MLKHALFAVGILVWVFGAELVSAKDNFTCRKNNLGHHIYTCMDSTWGTLMQNNFGHYQDYRTGEVYRQNNMGHFRSSDGKQNWGKDYLNNWRTGML
ncbi:MULTISPECIES: hypothetical protein [Marinobacter]|uniref:hypothetical protein n=1 Tax=Marinobacter TaxID=2742 RepID=UPI003B4345AD|nr:hypothetical protein PBN92_07015 [Marinobacter alkaliphilus]